MIHSVRPTVPASCDHYFQATFVLRYFKSGDGRRDGNMCKNNDHCRPGLWAPEWINSRQTWLSNPGPCLEMTPEAREYNVVMTTRMTLLYSAL